MEISTTGTVLSRGRFMQKSRNRGEGDAFRTDGLQPFGDLFQHEWVGTNGRDGGVAGPRHFLKRPQSLGYGVPVESVSPMVICFFCQARPIAPPMAGVNDRVAPATSRTAMPFSFKVSKTGL